MHAAKYPVIAKLLDYREASKRLDTYGPEWLKNIHPKTGYVHSSFYPFTGAGRYASSKPNIQNIPRDAAFRACFQAEPGQVLILSDYGNIEMRIIAELSGDKLLIQIFVDNGDAHYRTASILTGKAESAITKKERQEAKPVNFGFIYGMQAPKLVLYAQSAYKVSLTLDKAKLFRQRYFEAYVGVGRWHRKIENALEECQKSKKMYEARTLAGRLRILDPNTAFNECKNTPSQGTGADGLKAALREVYMRLKKYGGTGRWDQPFTVKMRNHVHDEIMLSAPSSGSAEDTERQQYAKDDLSEGMKAGIQPMLKRVPVTADAAIATSWADK
jgi:DNA polymerase-1